MGQVCSVLMKGEEVSFGARFQPQLKSSLAPPSLMQSGEAEARKGRGKALPLCHALLSDCQTTLCQLLQG